MPPAGNNWLACTRPKQAVYYVDKMRFLRQAPVPYAWQVRGYPCACLPAERGARGGHSVLGFWRPAESLATGRQVFTAIVLATVFTAELFGLAVDEFVAHLLKLAVLANPSIHDASIHKAYHKAYLVKARVTARVTLL